MPRLGRASARAGFALAVSFLAGVPEYWPVKGVALDGSLWFGIMCAVAAALETIARGVPRLPHGVVSGGLIGLAELVRLLQSMGSDSFNGEQIGEMLGTGLGMAFGVRLAVRLLARGRTGLAVYTALHIAALGTFTALLTHGSIAGTTSAMVIDSTAFVVIGSTAGLGVTLGPRTLNALRKSAQSTQ